MVLGAALALMSACNLSIEVNPRPAPTADVEIVSLGTTETRDCGNKTVTINSSGSAITLTGTCPSVAVWGSNNRVTIEAVDLIEVSGSGHSITFQRGIRQREPTVNVNGSGISVLPAGTAR